MASYERRGSSIRAVVRLPGGGKLSRTFKAMRLARAWAEAAERRKAVGELQPDEQPKADQVTAGQLFLLYEEMVASRMDSARWDRLRFTQFLADPLAKLPILAITPHDINEWIIRREATKVSGATVNRELNLISAAFTYAVKDKRWLDTNPCHDARRPERGRPRNRPMLTVDEIAAILHSSGYDRDPSLKTLSARVGACFLLSLETGMRSGELLRLRPQDFDRNARTIHVAAIEPGGRKSAKSGRAHLDPSRDVPLTARAIELLDQLLVSMPDNQPYIVAMTDSQRDALWRKARNLAGVRDLHFHDTKHEAATRMARFLDVLALSRALGNKNLSILRETYYQADAAEAALLLPFSLAKPKLT